MPIDGPIFNKVVQYHTGRRGTAVALLTAALGTLPLANQNYNWPNPERPRRSIALYTHAYLALALTVFPLVDGQNNQPNPIVRQFPVVLRTHTDGFRLPLTSVTPPFFQEDWPVPRGPQPTQWLTWTDSFKLPLTTHTPQGRLLDWPVPRGPKPVVLDWKDSFKLPLTTVVPPNIQHDWPVPRGQKPVVLDWKDSFKLPLTTVKPPFTQYDFPNPRGPARSIDALSWQTSGNTAIITTAAVQPQPDGRLLDWPNPVLRGGFPTYLQKFEDHYSIQDIPALQRWDSPNPPLGARGIYAGISSIGGDISAITPVPANQFDWPVPRGPQPTHLRTWTDSFKLTLTTVRPTSANKDWPNPRGQIPVPVGFKDSFKLTLTTVRPAGRLLDWPNPSKVVRTDNLRWTQGPFLGTTATVTQPFVQTDWPVPRGSAPRDLRGYRDSFKLPLTTVRPTGRQLDWPLQFRVVRTENLRWTQGPFIGTTVTAVRPFFQIEWPNPRNVRRRKTPPAMVADVEIAETSPGACIVGGYFSKGQWRTVIGTPCPPKKRRSYKEPGFSRQQYEDLLEAIKTGEYQPSQRKVKRWFEGGAFTRAQYDDIKATIRLEQETRALQEKLAAEALAFAETRAHEDRLAAIEAAAQAAQAQNDIQAQAAQLEASSKLQALQNHLRMAEAVVTAARRAKAEEEDDEKAIAMLFGDD